MTVLLDTNAFLWWLHDQRKITPRARKSISAAEANGRILVSAISIWEVAVKCRLGKLNLPLDINAWFEKAREYPAIIIEPLSPKDAIASTLLPGDFRNDPADRIIIAIARRIGCPLITSDKSIINYSHVNTIW